MPNSEWQKRSGDHATDRNLVDEAVNDQKAFLKLMTKYRDVVYAYMNERFAAEEARPISREELRQAEREGRKFKKSLSPEVLDGIWAEIVFAMPEMLAKKWVGERKGFREILLSAIHNAHHTWSKPRIRFAAAMPEPDAGMLDRLARPEILRRVWRKLEAYERQHAKTGSRPHTLLTLRMAHPEESLAAFGERLAAMPNGMQSKPQALRKALSRARQLYHSYIHE